jgi:NADH-quinone oxidoreductase subunit C
MATIESLQAAIQTRFAAQINHILLARDELTLEVAAEHLRDLSKALRDEPEFDFKLLIDVCGVDYLHYGISEWETASATSTGFERGVEMQPVPKAHDGWAPVFKGGHDLSDGAVPSTEKNVDDFPVETKEALFPFENNKGRFAKHRFASVYHLLSLKNNHRIRLRVFIDANTMQVPSITDIWPAANWFEREAFDLFGIIFIGHPDLRRILTDYGFIGHPFRKDFPLIGNVEARYDAALQRVVYEPVSIQPRILEPKVIRTDNRYESGA